MISNKLLVNDITNFIKLLPHMVFEVNIVNDCVYHKFSGSKYIFLVLYVDDILLTNNNTLKPLFY